tara:strand:+ start:2715 stop:3845 length:1131 start_codon:yes stop_codon:yes gene_type:complete
MTSEIYIILHQPLSNYILDRFGFNHDFHNITYLNILPLINSKVSQSYNNSNYKKDNFINFTSIISLLKFLIRKKNNFFYTNTTGKNFFSILIDFIFNFQNGIKFDVIQTSLPLGKIGRKNLKNSFRLPKLILIKKLTSKIVDIFNNFIYKLLCRDAEIIFVSNNHAFDKLNKKKLIFKINQLDYYNFNKSNHENIVQDYFCFIDQEQENSFENQLYFTSYIPNYLDRISKLLKLIEKKTQLKVKIALHHRNKDIPIQYSSFDCIKDHSMDLIKNSKFVVTHNSTALNFAIMSKKPINLIWLNEFKARLSKNATMKKLAEDLDCNIIDEHQNLDDITFQKQINEIKYNEFLKSYINFNEKIPLEHPWKTIHKQLGKL